MRVVWIMVSVDRCCVALLLYIFSLFSSGVVFFVCCRFS